MNKKFTLVLLFIGVIMVMSGVKLSAATLSYSETEVVSSGEIISNVEYKQAKAVATNDAGTQTNQLVSYVKASKDQVNLAVYSSITASGIVGKTVLDLAKEYESTHQGVKVLAAINADYFSASGSNLYPINALVMDGEVIKYNNHAKYQSLAMNTDGSDYAVSKQMTATEKYFLTIYDETGTYPIKEIMLNGENLKPQNNQTTFFYKYTSVQTYNDVDMFEVSKPIANFNLASKYIKGKITSKINTITSNPIIATTNKEVSDLLKTNPLIRVQKQIEGENDKYPIIVGFGSQPLANNVIKEDSQIGDQDLSFVRARHPRSSIGFTADGGFIIAAIDGRQTNMAGVSLREEAAIMQSLGAVDCFNFDGGGSTQLVIRQNDQLVIYNSPSENRKVVNIMLLVAPDVTVNNTSSVESATSAKINYNYTSASGITVESFEVYANQEKVENPTSGMVVKDLKQGEANFIRYVVKYLKNSTSYSKVVTDKIYTTEIGDSGKIEKEKPSNFNVSYLKSTSGFDVVVSFTDDYETLTKLYVYINGDRKIATKGSGGHTVEVNNVTETTNYTIEIEYYYCLNSVTVLSEKFDQTFTYQYVVAPTSPTYRYNSLGQGKIEVLIDFNNRGTTLSDLKLKVDNRLFDVVDNKVTIENISNGSHDFSLKYAYNDGTEVVNVETDPIAIDVATGCNVFGFNSVVTLLLSLGLVNFILRKKRF